MPLRLNSRPQAGAPQPASPFRNGAPRATRPGRQLKPLIAAGAVGLLFLLLAGFLAVRLWPREGCTTVGGVCLPERWFAFWQEYQVWLGEPEAVGTYEGRPDCLTTRAYRICRRDTTTPATLLEGYEVINLGWRVAEAANLQPRLGTMPEAIVAGYLDQLAALGINWRFFVGPVATGPVCLVDGSGQGGSCVVHTLNQVLRYPLGSTNPADVRLDMGYQTRRP